MDNRKFDPLAKAVAETTYIHCVLNIVMCVVCIVCLGKGLSTIVVYSYS